MNPSEAIVARIEFDGQAVLVPAPHGESHPRLGAALLAHEPRPDDPGRRAGDADAALPAGASLRGRPRSNELRASGGTKVEPYRGMRRHGSDRGETTLTANTPESRRAGQIAVEREAKFIDFARSAMWTARSACLSTGGDGRARRAKMTASSCTHEGAMKSRLPAPSQVKAYLLACTLAAIVQLSVSIVV